MGKNLEVTVVCPGPTFSNFLAQSFTGRRGEIYGRGVQDTDRRMTTERCALLFAVAIVNKLDEAWMGISPSILLIYVSVYWPNLAKLGLKIVGRERIMRMRDSSSRAVVEQV